MSLSRELASGLVGASVVTAIVSSSVFLRKADYEVRPSFQPKNIAFSIWSVIFLAGGVHALGLGLGQVTPEWRSVVYACAFFMAGAWAPVFSRGWRKLALGAIFSAAALASAATWGSGRGATDTTNILYVDVPYGLLSGWLLVATALMVVIAGGAGGVLDTPWSLVGLLGAVGVTCLVTRTFVPLLPVLWACSLQKRDY